MVELGRDEYGPARVPAHASDGRQAALGPEAAPNRFAEEAGNVRAAVARESGQFEMREPLKTIASAPADADGAVKDIELQRDRHEDLVSRLPGLRAEVREAEGVVDARRAALGRLSRSQLGYIGSRILVIAVVAAVSVFDAFVIHAALEKSGLSAVSLWGTTLTVPLAVWAVNHALGLTAGAIAIRMRAERIRLAVLAFVAGAGSLLVAFVMLAFFRVQAIDQQNEVLERLIEGDTVDQINVLVNPLWFGPLQVAGSIAAIAVVALWTAGVAGRDARAELADAVGALKALQAKLAAAESAADAAWSALRAAELRPTEIRAASAAAEVDIEITEAAVAEEVDQELSLARAYQALYEAEYLWADKIYENGRVERCAMPTHVRLLSRPVTPAPTDRPSDLDERDDHGVGV